MSLLVTCLSRYRSFTGRLVGSPEILASPVEVSESQVTPKTTKKTHPVKHMKLTAFDEKGHHTIIMSVKFNDGFTLPVDPKAANQKIADKLPGWMPSAKGQLAVTAEYTGPNDYQVSFLYKVSF